MLDFKIVLPDSVVQPYSPLGKKADCMSIQKVSIDSIPLCSPGECMLHCTLCDYACVGEERLDRHVKQRHDHIGRNGRHKCEWCEYPTDDMRVMTRHLRTHTGERPFSCDDCGKAFARRSDVTAHRRTHSGLRPHVCDVCGKAFTKSSNLTRHERIHTGEMVRRCEQCGATFSQVHHYALHMKTHDDVKDYQCHVCSARFVTRWQLTCHLRTHMEERPYGCPFCPARFKQRSTMTRHVVAKHTHDYRHRCGRCGKGFVFASHRRRHEDRCTLTDALLTAG